MRRELIHQLDYKERKWLYKAITRMVIVDKAVLKQEIEDLKESLAGLSGAETKDLKHVIEDPDFKLPLRKLDNISYESAFIILSEIARLAAIDAKVAQEEKILISEILQLLSFDAEATDQIVSWMENLAKVNLEESRLKDALSKHYLGGF